MQDYVDEKTMALVVKVGKITARILREAIKDFMKIEHKVKDKAHTGKQSLKSLQKSGTALTCCCYQFRVSCDSRIFSSGNGDLAHACAIFNMR